MRRIVTGLALALAAGGCGGGARGGGALEGSIEADGSVLGAWTLVPDSCVSGQRQEFYGVILLDSEDERLQIKVVVDPLEGLALVATIPEGCEPGGLCEAVVIRASECEGLHGDVRRDTSISTNSIWHMEGWVDVECRIGDGHLRGAIEFSACH